MRLPSHQPIFSRKPLVTPSGPIRMMRVDPFRMMVVPPRAVVPHMIFVIVAVVGAPLGIHGNPFRMMRVDPAGVMFMPPARVMPDVTAVPVPVVTVRMSNHGSSREQRCEGSGGENCSKFHSSNLLLRARTKYASSDHYEASVVPVSGG